MPSSVDAAYDDAFGERNDDGVVESDFCDGLELEICLGVVVWTFIDDDDDGGGWDDDDDNVVDETSVDWLEIVGLSRVDNGGANDDDVDDCSTDDGCFDDGGSVVDGCVDNGNADDGCAGEDAEEDGAADVSDGINDVNDALDKCEEAVFMDWVVVASVVVGCSYTVKLSGRILWLQTSPFVEEVLQQNLTARRNGGKINLS